MGPRVGSTIVAVFLAGHLCAAWHDEPRAGVRRHAFDVPEPAWPAMRTVADPEQWYLFSHALDDCLDGMEEP